MMDYQYLKYQVSERMAWITLNRPEKLNALNKALWKELQTVLLTADADDEVSVIVLTGSGRGFCAGDDIAELTRLKSPKDAEDLFLGCIYGLVNCIFRLQKPFLSAVNGIAYGGGCELVLLTDIAIASEEARFAQPEGRIGAWPPIFAVFGPPMVGVKATQEFLLAAEPINPQRALEIGLINRVVPHGRLRESTVEMARSIMKSSAASTRIIKETVNQALGRYLYDFWITCQRFLHEVSKTQDFLEGATAFLEKRPPRFQGR
jgi:enoyl-CoA hydratase / 3-hydroxyacyl-CoA dehydrogenase